MDEKMKLEYKKSGLTVTGLVISMIIVIGVFSAMFIYMGDQADRGGAVVDTKYNETFNQLEETQENLDVKVNQIQVNLDDIKEADSTYQVAWNGLKGLGNTLLLPISFISYGVETISAIFIPLDFIPQQIKNLIILGLLVVMIFLILAVVKGEPKT